MFPKLIEFETPKFLQGLLPDHISVYSYGFMIALGILVAFIIALRMSRKFGVDSDKLSNLFFWVIIVAFIGGKLFFYLEDPQRYIEDPGSMLRLSGGGFVFYGSLIFAIPAIVWWLKRQKIPIRPFLDILAFVGPVVHSFGRVGCFMAGCCYGEVCHNALGVTFSHPETLASPVDTPLYPTQLFDIAVNLIILATVLLVQKKKAFEGQLFLIYLMMYGVGRSIVELYRGDEARGYVIDNVLTHSQFIAIIIIAVCIFFWMRWRKPKTTT
ncbi:MAG: prolipoprotein diacylglyceryl transferase [Bacteroidia bacterium]